jgi:ribosomal 30S subunit maturation factor RimM
VEVLKLLNKIIGKCENIYDTKDKDNWKFASILVSPAFEKLIPTINHCIKNINQEDSVLYQDLLSGSSELFVKIQRAGLGHQLIKENNHEQ